MQKTRRGVRASDGARYRERLSPSLPVMAAAALVAPMAALVLAPIDTTLALACGVVAGAVFVALLVAGAPVIEVDGGMLRAGRARIGVEHTGDVVVLEAEAARQARGPGLNPRSWHVIRGGIDAIVMVEITDPDDPAPHWVLSTRTPDRLAAALRYEQAARRTPYR